MTKNEKWLSSLKTLTNIKVLIKALGLTPQSEVKFWYDLLALLKSETGPIKFEQGEDSQDSLMGFITTYADLADEESEPIISSLYTELKRLVYDDENDSFWNQSMQKLIEYFIKNLEEVDNQLLLPIDNDTHDITVGTLKESDAGYNLPDSRPAGDQWVKPWWNIDNENYDDVRKCDEVYNILKNQNKLQYTRKPYNPTVGGEEEEEAFKNWIRLLIPQYGRRVEIEDLDRNFWVIAQTIAAISSYLFNPDSPLPKMWEGLTREISEIWENILYLWTGIAAITQKHNSSDVSVLHLPLQLRDNEHGRKYDNIDINVDWYSYEDDGHGYINITRGENFDEEVEKRLAYLIDEYADKNLCIIPFIRLDNYKHNYYAASWYPGVYMYHQGTKEWTVYKFIEIPENVNRVEENTPLRELVISPKYDRNFRILQEGENPTTRYSQHIYASKQSEDECIYYSSPFSKTKKTKADFARFLLYGCLRISISDSYVDCEVTPDEFIIHNVDIDVCDAATPLIEGDSVGAIGYYRVKEVGDHVLYINYYDRKRQIDDRLEVICNNPTAGYSGYYMGEVASWKAKTISERRSTNLFNSIAHVIKVGSYLRSKKANSQPLDTFETAVMGEGTHTLMKGNVTESTGAGNEMKFYLNDWSSYLPEKDQEDITTGNQKELCFSNNPIAVSCGQINERFLAEKGLIATMEYLKKINALKQPCYIATAMGLLPWNNEYNLIYWNVGALCHIYHYIPSQSSLEIQPSEGDTSYSDQYNSFNACTIGGVEGTIIINGVEVGKIISCNLIKMYDSFYDNFGMVSAQVYTLAAWRQFQIKADSSESCYCIITNPDDEDREVTYNVNFSTIFNGEVNYFDNRWSKNHAVPVFTDGAQVGTAKVTMSASGYTQSHEIGNEGRIAACTNVGVELKDRPNISVDVYNTGFIKPEQGTVDFMNIPVGTTQAAVCTRATTDTRNWIYT